MRNPQRTVLGALLVLVVLVALSAARSPPNGSLGSSQRSKSIGTDLSISSVSILLPQSRSVKYKLEAFNGCFEWCVFCPCLFVFMSCNCHFCMCLTMKMWFWLRVVV